MTDDRHVVARVEPCAKYDRGLPDRYCDLSPRCHGCQGDGTRLEVVAAVAKRRFSVTSRYSHVPAVEVGWKEVTDDT